MSNVANKRVVMTLYSGSNDIASHSTRIVLAEKGVAFEVINVDQMEMPEMFLEVNPYGIYPTLVDRDLVLHNERIIMEYLDERFPHPPLMQVYPIAKARLRLMMHRIKHEWQSLVDKILANKGSAEEIAKMRTELTDNLVNALPAFANTAYFLGEDFTLLDCVIAPILWRLPLLKLDIPKDAKAILEYADRVFERPAFEASLTEIEYEIRQDIYTTA